jgi:hypothetical protein
MKIERRKTYVMVFASPVKKKWMQIPKQGRHPEDNKKTPPTI